MPTRSIVIAVALAAGIFGLLAAGCNNGKRTARAPRAVRSAPGPEVAVARSRSVRPAEVLAATAHRSESSQNSVQPVRTSVAGSRIAEPLPEPIVLAAATPVRRAAQQTQFRPAPVAPAVPAFRSIPVAAPARSSSVPGPELAMAQAGLAPMAAPAIRQGYRVQRLPAAPIPELEPVRLRRMPEVLTTRRPAAEVMMSSGAPAGRDLRHALAPLGNDAPAGHDWVPTPTTAMLH